MTHRVLFSFFLGAMLLSGGPVCGPGAHWIDTCSTGTDSFMSVAKLSATLFGGPVSGILMGGPTTIWRSNPMDQLGPYGAIDGHLDVIQTEMVSMSLTGMIGGFAATLTAGDGIGNGLPDGPLYSRGVITEVPGNNALGDSFFDVFFQINIPALNLTLSNQDPMIMGCSDLRGVPPVGRDRICIYTGLGPVRLFPDVGGQPVFVNADAHIPTPEPETVSLLGPAIAGLVWLRHRRHVRAKASQQH